MRKWPVGALVLALALSLLPAANAQADDLALKKVMRNALYGGAIGALVGTAILVFNDTPSDNLDFITKGAAVGVLGGVVYGVYDSQSAYVSLENGRIHTAMSAPVLHRVKPSVADVGRNEVMVTARVLGVRFPGKRSPACLL